MDASIRAFSGIIRKSVCTNQDVAGLIQCKASLRANKTCNQVLEQSPLL